MSCNVVIKAAAEVMDITEPVGMTTVRYSEIHWTGELGYGRVYQDSSFTKIFIEDSRFSARQYMCTTSGVQKDIISELGTSREIFCESTKMFSYLYINDSWREESDRRCITHHRF